MKGQWLYSLTQRKISFMFIEINKWANPPGDDLAVENNNYKTIVYVYVCAHACVCILIFKTDWRHIKVPYNNKLVIASPGTLHMNETNYLYLALHLPQSKR